MEEEEAFRLKTHEAKKNLQRQKRATQKLAHEKLVSRQTSKDYLSSLKSSIYGQLTDVGFFYNKFSEETLKTDVLPWLYNETEAYLAELDEAEQLPTQLIDGYVDEMAQTHKSTIA